MPTQNELLAFAVTGDFRSIAPEGVGQFRWKEISDLPVSEFTRRPLAGVRKLQSKAMWMEWLEDEKVRHDYPEYYEELERAWTEDPNKVGPILVAYTPGGKIDVGDGWHRIAISVANGMKIVPAVVGYPK